jgi:oxalate---CoA ligase
LVSCSLFFLNRTPDHTLGSNVSRLRDFILDFYAQTGTSTPIQNPDDAFCAFVWSLVVQQPSVSIGLIPPGLTSEVWIAPQTSAKRKAKVLGVEHVETSPSKLDPITDPKSTPLDLLRQAYGERLRIAAEPESIFSAITGTHIRVSHYDLIKHHLIHVFL